MKIKEVKKQNKKSGPAKGLVNKKNIEKLKLFFENQLNKNVHP